MEKFTFFVFESGGQCFGADFALEILPNERADTRALANRAFVLPHPSLEAVEMNQAQFALAIAGIDQRVLRLISAMEAHSASFFLIARLLLTFRLINQLCSLELKFVSINFFVIGIFDMHIPYNKFSFAKSNNIVKFQFLLLALRDSFRVWKWSKLKPQFLVFLLGKGVRQ